MRRVCRTNILVCNKRPVVFPNLFYDVKFVGSNLLRDEPWENSTALLVYSEITPNIRRYVEAVARVASRE